MEFFEAPVSSQPVPVSEQQVDSIFLMANDVTPEVAPVGELFLGALPTEGLAGISEGLEAPIIAPPPFISAPLPFEPISATISAPAPPETVDPRVEWRRLNTEKLKKQDIEEAEAKAKQQAKAKDYVKKFLEERNAKVAATKEDHIKSDVKKADEAKFENIWDKIIDYTKTPGTVNHTKDVTKMKSILLSAKTKDVLVL